MSSGQTQICHWNTGRLVKGHVGFQRQGNGVSNDVPGRELLDVPRCRQRVDPGLQGGGDAVAVLRNQLAGNKKGSDVCIVAHADE